MNSESVNVGYLWIISEICYYLGLVLAVLFLPALSAILWMLSLLDKVEPNYLYILSAWSVSILMFLIGILLKNWICANESKLTPSNKD